MLKVDVISKGIMIRVEEKLIRTPTFYYIEDFRKDAVSTYLNSIGVEYTINPTNEKVEQKNKYRSSGLKKIPYNGTRTGVKVGITI